MVGRGGEQGSRKDIARMVPEFIWIMWKVGIDRKERNIGKVKDIGNRRRDR